ncbi:MAG: ATP-binding protein [Nitrososphaerota archaeon]|nr:ATP-binding protein [Nitrososphaerota archaeon]
MADDEEIVGVFIGLQSSTYEYIANIIAPYKTDFSIELGSFLLIHDLPFKLVARVIDLVPQGELTSFMGQKWLSDVAFEAEAIGSDIKRRKISYSVKIKILGTLDSKNKFIPGLRKIPHITSRVVRPESHLVEQIIHQALDEQQKGSKIGDYSLDEKIAVKFDLNTLLAKRTFVFARAGYGKSNLMKVIASKWKEDFGSLVVFDPDGEYAFTDKKQRPGVLDAKEAILITNRSENQDVQNVYRKIRLNLKEFDPKFIIPILVPPEKHENIFFQKLMSMNRQQWSGLVDLFERDGWRADLNAINGILNVAGEEAQNMTPIRNNLVYPIQQLHDPTSHLMQIIESAIRKGSVVIIDVSRLNSRLALWLSSIVVKQVLNENQRNFIQGSPEDLMRATFAIDEAQSVLSKESSVEAFVELAKEGRKYSLGAIFITQQPGSIPFEILSQADNFFVFHLLSKGDLDALQRANAHYSNDIITEALNEPKPGKCYMWTSTQPFVLPVQVDLFETPEIANKAKDVQSKSKLLAGIIEKVTEEFTNPLFQSILSKYRRVESDHGQEDIKNKTITLFKSLTPEERDYAKNQKGIQIGIDRKDFAVTYKYYNELGELSGTLSDNS